MCTFINIFWKIRNLKPRWSQSGPKKTKSEKMLGGTAGSRVSSCLITKYYSRKKKFPMNSALIYPSSLSLLLFSCMNFPLHPVILTFIFPHFSILHDFFKITIYDPFPFMLNVLIFPPFLICISIKKIFFGRNYIITFIDDAIHYTLIAPHHPFSTQYLSHSTNSSQ